MDLLEMEIPKEEDTLYENLRKELYDKRILILNKTVDDTILEDVSLNILKWNAEDKGKLPEYRKPIYIFVNSDGGDVVSGASLLNVIENSKTKVITVGFSKCFSMASYILAAGHERYCFPHTVVLYHDGTVGYSTSGNKAKDIQRFIDELDDNMTSFMIKHSKMSKEFLEEVKDREYYMFAKDAKEKGLVDKIIGIDCDFDEII